MLDAAAVGGYNDDSDTDESMVSFTEDKDYFQREHQSSDQAAGWYYLTRNDQGREAYGNLPKRKLPSGGFHLLTNYANNMVLEDMKREVTSTLSKIRGSSVE